jgi:hypothetical protein
MSLWKKIAGIKPGSISKQEVLVERSVNLRFFYAASKNVIQKLNERITGY